jgi:hypothetical protein
MRSTTFFLCMMATDEGNIQRLMSLHTRKQIKTTCCTRSTTRRRTNSPAFGYQATVPRCVTPTATSSSTG